MVILIALVTHWFLSLFLHSFFLHRYAAHQMFKMNKFWENFFYALTYLVQNVSFLSPRAYAILHRMHHTYSDTEDDPHSPLFYPNVFKMMVQTRDVYMDIFDKKQDILPEFEGGYPEHDKFDAFASSKFSRIGWTLVFIGFYAAFATQWWMWLFMPLHWIMSPLQGAIVNWFGHKTGYRNYDSPDNSHNTTPVDIIMLGELFQNNHHHRPVDPNFAAKWWEIDPVYPFMKVMSWLGIIRFTLDKEKRRATMTAQEFAAYTREQARLAAMTAQEFATYTREQARLAALSAQELAEYTRDQAKNVANRAIEATKEATNPPSPSAV
jgi:stearoyl-CoA desaturase (delta-9 desaturase)